MAHIPQPEDHPFYAFIHGDSDAQDTLPRLLRDRLLALARRVAPDLADCDLQEDVVQRMWELVLIRPPRSYHPDYSGAMAYLGALIKTAATDVRAEHTPPGERTRRYRRPNKQERRAYMRALIHDYDHAEQIDAYSPWSHPRWGEVPDPHDPIRDLESRLTGLEILALARHTGAPQHLIRALALIDDNDVLLGEAARAVGTSRHALRRNLNAWLRYNLTHLARRIGHHRRARTTTR